MITRMVRLAACGVLPLLSAMVLMAMTASALAATPSELLQKAIYTEETVGNLDEAMKLYEKVIAAGKAGEVAAAQAQYRLGLCHLKKGNDAAATAAFESLIKNYPNATDLIAQARKHLPSGLKLLPAPWVNGERLYLDMKLPTGLDIGTMIYMVDAAKLDGPDVTRCSTRGLVTVNDANSFSEVLCVPESFRPIKSLWKHSLLGEADAVYSDNSATITVVSGKDKPFTIPFEPPAFDNEQCVELFRRLPLAIGYKTTISVITSLGGNNIRIPVSVTGTESITVPAGTFECYKLELGLVNQTFWVSNDEHRYVVRFAAGGVTANLAKIEQTKPGEPESFSGTDFSLTLPAGWLTYAPAEPFKQEKGTKVFLLDPLAIAQTEAEAKPKDSLKEAERASSKAWSEAFIAEISRVYADFKVREPGLSETTVGSLPATLLVADFNYNGKKMSMVGVAVIGAESAANLRLTTEADKLDELRPDFDAIVGSFELK